MSLKKRPDFAKHCIPETMFDYVNILLPEMFSDSAIAKEMALGRTKAGCLLTIVSKIVWSNILSQ